MNGTATLVIGLMLFIVLAHVYGVVVLLGK
jgi:hypothetical protein